MGKAGQSPVFLDTDVGSSYVRFHFAVLLLALGVGRRIRSVRSRRTRLSAISNEAARPRSNSVRLTGASYPVKLIAGTPASRRRPFSLGFGEHSVAGGRILKLLVLLFIVLLVFSNRLPSVARSLGQTVSEFKKGFKELDESSDDDSRQS